MFPPPTPMHQAQDRGSFHNHLSPIPCTGQTTPCALAGPGSAQPLSRGMQPVGGRQPAGSDSKVTLARGGGCRWPEIPAGLSPPSLHHCPAAVAAMTASSQPRPMSCSENVHRAQVTCRDFSRKESAF